MFSIVELLFSPFLHDLGPEEELGRVCVETDWFTDASVGANTSNTDIWRLSHTPLPV